jgi:hypothetical protein
MIVMYHKLIQIKWQQRANRFKMVCIGDDQTYTAMAKTVGLVAITLLILNGKITTPGVQLPIRKEVYEPILKELEDYGVILRKLPCRI